MVQLVSAPVMVTVPFGVVPVPSETVTITVTHSFLLGAVGNMPVMVVDELNGVGVDVLVAV